ncbi:hypothetical protein ASPZODRAFT_1465315 [Penicilliopsis zonata CBS 506.65]|uniref:AB hydrolase-1 domain-containing protein n=1 Tax=Penicilliopsis zonata CBS 506.65 TaxID=1073090 RepID=A0A1L9SQJ6_9EURO|nr:hypothetical protein ASPZODRAFT_1465315 [Penicilliopsis zonata CBS 506.65]OJJ49363.1 hypothetical protein ASPZODRAFT_1465315 [Penicilliopsis zonata CBS 506.65]
MSPPGPFRVVEHTIPCQHIREYPGATANVQEDVLHLAVKQYIPLDNLDPQSGDVTIIGAHANGFPKELYEPLWEDIYARSRSNGFRIRSIWMADVAHQGQSGVINEDLIGNDPSWLDHPRDLLHFINLKRAEMPRPIIGIGHSMGGAHLVQLCLMHPRLLHTLVLLDPVIQRETTQFDSPDVVEERKHISRTTQLSTYRKDLWESRRDAAEGFQRSPFYKTWDPRVLERWVQYGLRDLPTAIHPLLEGTSKDGKPPVTLTTTLHQEVFTFSRPNYEFDTGKPINKTTHPDLNPDQAGASPFYRPEPLRIFAQIPHLRPSVLYIFGGKSELSTPKLRADKIAHTGTGTGGSGGVLAGRVREVCLEEHGHLLAQEAATECAIAAAPWLGAELQRWQDEERVFHAQWSKKSKVEKLTIDAEWKKHVQMPERRAGTPKTKL